MSLPKANPTRSFWLNHNPLESYRTTNELPTNADVVIVGLGLTGTGALFNLSRKHPHLNILALEARDPVSGATGRNGGHLTPFSFRGFRQDSEIMGEKPAYLKRLLERHNTDHLVGIINENSIACDLQEGTGNLQCCDAQEFADAKLDLAAFEVADKRFGGNLLENVEIWEKETVLEKLGDNSAAGALLIPAHQLWPAKFCWGLHQEFIKNKNVNIQSRTPATRIYQQKGSGKWQVETPRGSVVCDVVLLASNAWAGHLLPLPLQKALVPTRAQVIAFQSEHDHKINVKEWTRGFSLHHGSEYMIRRGKDGVYVIGGGREDIPGQQMYESDDSVLNKGVGAALRSVMKSIFPELLPESEDRIQEWTGIMCYTVDGKPIVGQVPGAPGQFVAIGYNGHGMPFAFQSGQYIADQAVNYLQRHVSSVTDEKIREPTLVQEAWQLFDPSRFDVAFAEKVDAGVSLPSRSVRLSNTLRRNRHWLLLGLLFLIFGQYALCCE
ncbi:FAD dependent oxidoreductase-domain-containing protein [Umbelopsis sp. AD052]|nr:FAD dependent oxidoreductase-domain-containing protein [Umbelopsis sp. AD052]